MSRGEVPALKKKGVVFYTAVVIDTGLRITGVPYLGFPTMWRGILFLSDVARRS